MKEPREDNLPAARETETHPFEPFFPDGARLLMCGTFPAKPVRWSMKFYYPNFINDMWRIFGLIYFGDKEALVDREARTFRLPEIKRLLTDRHIALSDTGAEISRLKGNASDKYLEILRPIDLKGALTRLPETAAVATTGALAAEVIASLTGSAVPKTGEYVEFANPSPEGRNRTVRHWRMPSTSRAYPMRLETKAGFYRKMLEYENLL